MELCMLSTVPMNYVSQTHAYSSDAQMISNLKLDISPKGEIPLMWDGARNKDWVQVGLLFWGAGESSASFCQLVRPLEINCL